VITILIFYNIFVLTYLIIHFSRDEPEEIPPYLYESCEKRVVEMLGRRFPFLRAFHESTKR